MSEIDTAIELAFKGFKEKHGENAELEDGDEFVTVFNNCSLIISFRNDKLKTKFIGGKPIEVDFSLHIFKTQDNSESTN